jgi:uncharacterized protein YxeA
VIYWERTNPWLHTIHESAADVKDGQNVSLPAVSYTTFKYYDKEGKKLSVNILIITTSKM